MLVASIDFFMIIGVTYGHRSKVMSSLQQAYQGRTVHPFSARDGRLRKLQQPALRESGKRTHPFHPKYHDLRVSKILTSFPTVSCKKTSTLRALKGVKLRNLCLARTQMSKGFPIFHDFVCISQSFKIFASSLHSTETLSCQIESVDSTSVQGNFLNQDGEGRSLSTQ